MSSSAITGPVLSDVRRAPSGTAAAPSFAFNDSTGTGVYLVSAGVLGLSTAGVQRVVVDASGNVGIGTASPSVASGSGLEINGKTDAARIALKNNTTGSASGDGFQITAGFDGFAYIEQRENNPMVFSTNLTERMRLDASGRLLVGTASPISASGAPLQSSGASGPAFAFNRTDDGGVGYFYRGSTLVGNINVTTTGTTYNSGASDYRLKDQIAPLNDGLKTICSLKPVTFNWKEHNKKDVGFIAHELQEVIPEAVSGEKDAVDSEGNPQYQMIFPAPAQMVANLVAAIQELKAELDEAKAKIAALESK